MSECISLAGNAPLGTSSLTISGDDYVSGGKTHSYPDGQNSIVATFDGTGCSFSPVPVSGADLDAPVARFAAPAGAPLAVGSHRAVAYLDATNPSHPSKQYGLVVGGFGRGCSSETETVGAPDVAFTVSRLVAGDGADAGPTSGLALSSSDLSSVALPGLDAGQTYTVVVFAIDTTGSVSPAATKSFTG